jgi:hypothetical protein
MLRGDHHVHLEIHQLRSNRERGRVAWMYGNYYCIHAIFVEKTDGIRKKSVSLGMGVIRINRKSDKVECSEDMGHLHFPIVTKPRHSAKRKWTGGDSTTRPLFMYDFDLSCDHLSKKSVTVFTKLVEMCFLRFPICDLWLWIFLWAEERKSINLPEPRTCQEEKER